MQKRQQLRLEGPGTRTELSFKEVPEDDVFLTRLVEKDEKVARKARLQSAKIWNKSTATTRAPLTRIKDNDYDPAKPDEKRPNYSYSARNRSLIAAAMQVARQRNLMSAKNRGERNQPLQEFIDQKKEMYRTELKNNTLIAVTNQINEREHNK